MLFFIGRRDTITDIIPALESSIEDHIVNHGVTKFIVGHYGAFDKFVSTILIKAKTKHPHISLILLLPYHSAERKIALPKGFGGAWYPDGIKTAPRKAAIIKANRYAIEHSDYLIAHVWHSASNSRDILDYAYTHKSKELIKITLLKHI